ncbi:MAG: NAD(P)H-hydrate dehydratase, partial [Solirubrobacteraceae bacterium]
GALLAKHMDPFHAACAGVLVHAEAGRRAARELGPEGVIAGDVIAALPAVLRDLGAVPDATHRG